MRSSKLQLLPLVATLGMALCGLPLAAQAQSSVVVFGIVDSAVRHVDNDGVGSVTSLVSGGNNTSRLGLRGTEDLGNGLSAGFHLEHGILVDTGAAVSATQFWDRRATVGLVSKSLGEMRLGRDYVPSYTNWSRYDPFSYVGVAGANNFISATPVGPLRSTYASGGATTVRSSNAVQYILPSGLGGLEGSLMVAAGEGGTAANGQHKLIGARLGYAAETWGISVAHDRVENDLTTAGTHTDSAIGGNVTFAGVRLSAAYRVFEYADAKQSNILAAVVVPVGVSGEVKVSYNKVNLDGRVGAANISANDAYQVGLGYVHSLSKRTALYTTLSRISNSGAAVYAIPGGAAGLTRGGDSTGYEAGLRHSF